MTGGWPSGGSRRGLCGEGWGGLMPEAATWFGWEGAEVNLHRSGDIQLPTPPAGFITRPRTLLGFLFFS